MRILHYFLGFPPYRSGGLTKYAFDLMTAQQKDGHCVIALWPGQMRVLVRKIQLKKHNDIEGIINYELINPLPVPLDEGISETERFIVSCDMEVYMDFLKRQNVDVIHIHTLMGLHKEFIMAAKRLRIKTVFTTHDYFGLCPKVSFYNKGGVCENGRDCIDCVKCNETALPQWKIFVLQSMPYRNLKNSFFLKMLRKKHRTKFYFEEVTEDEVEKDAPPCEKVEKYLRLREYYVEMLSSIDVMHFNSSVAMQVYTRFFEPTDSRLITITHKDIVDNRGLLEWKYGEELKITYLAPPKPFKGYAILKEVLDEIYKLNEKKFVLKLFGDVPDRADYMNVVEDGFTHDELGQIFSETDILIAPSIWYETFGFTVLEAISYGVPVIVTDNVGAKDIVKDGGIVIRAGNKKDLKEAILSLDQKKLEQLRENVRNNITIKSWRQFLDENISMYKL